MLRKTKIVCTLGPASDSEEMVGKLMDAGMNVCRLNMSHGTYEEQGERIDRIKRLRKEKGVPVAILLDTKGPEVRTKTLAAGKVELEAGQEFVLTSREVEGDAHEVSITYPKMVELVKPGNRILIDDGAARPSSPPTTSAIAPLNRSSNWNRPRSMPFLSR